MHTGPDAWDRLAWLWHGLFYVTLAASTVIAVVVNSLRPADRPLGLALVAVFAVVHWLVLVRNPHWWADRFVPLAGYWLAACGLALALLALGGGPFGIVMYGLYPLMMVTLGWWGLVPVAGLTALAAMVVSWGWSDGAALSVASTSVVAAVIATFVSAVVRQSAERRGALEQLAATRAELARTSRAAGMLAERERLARELHDTVAQGFASVVTQVESAEQALDERIDDAREHLAKAGRIARESLTEVRRSVRALRPDLLEGASLTTALERTVREWSADRGVPAELRTTGEPAALASDTEHALLRTTQEALANVARHAGASRVVVSLSYLGDTVTLDVDDDGRGLSGGTGPRPDGGGYGLVGMRERVEAVGGRLTVESARGEGTTVAVSVPL